MDAGKRSGSELLWIKQLPHEGGDTWESLAQNWKYHHDEVVYGDPNKVQDFFQDRSLHSQIFNFVDYDARMWGQLYHIPPPCRQ